MSPPRAATQPPGITPGSPVAAPRRGAAPAAVTSSPASRTAKSASIILESGPGVLVRLLHEPQPILDLVLGAVHVEQPEVLLDGGADALGEGVALHPQRGDHPFQLAGLAPRLIQE